MPYTDDLKALIKKVEEKFLPGLAEALAAPVSEMLGRPVEVGPICAAELPLFFGRGWSR